MPKEDQGVFADRYMVIPRTLIFITCADTVLLLKGSPTKRIWPNLFNGIGGHIERGEDILSAAYRELGEETGLVDVKLHLVGTILVDADIATGIGIYVFHGESDTTPILVSPEGTLEWVRFDQLGNLPLVEDLPALLPNVLRSREKPVIFSGLSYYDDKDQMQIVFRLEEE